MYTQEEIIEFAESQNLSAEQFDELLNQMGDQITPSEATPPVVTEPQAVTESPELTLPEVVVTAPALSDKLQEEQPLELGEWTGRYNSEGRKIYPNNFGTESSEYTIGVNHPDINNNQTTHIPSIYNGKPIGQKEAMDIIIANGGKDPETGRLITPGGDPEARSKSLVKREEQPNDQGMFGFQSVAHPPLKPIGGEEQFTPTDPDSVNMVDRVTANLGVGLNEFGLAVGGLANSPDLQGYHRKRIQELRKDFPKQLLKEMDTPLWRVDPDSWSGYSLNPEASVAGGFGKLVKQAPHFASTIGVGAGLTKTIAPVLIKAIDKLPIKAVQKLFKPLGKKPYTVSGKDKAIVGIAGATGYGIAEGLVSGGFSRAEVGHAIRNATEEMLMGSEKYRELLAEGHPPEMAQEMLADDLSGAAMRKTMITTGLLGAPMGQFFGKLVQFPPNTLLRRILAGGLGGVGEASQEIPQEFMEFVITELAKGDAGLSVQKMEQGILQALEAGLIAGPMGTSATMILSSGDTDAEKLNKLKKLLEDVDIEDSQGFYQATKTIETEPEVDAEITLTKTYEPKIEEPPGQEEPVEVKPPPAPPIIKAPEPDPKIEEQKRIAQEEERQKIIETNKRKAEEERQKREEETKQRREEEAKKVEEERRKREDPEEIAKSVKKVITAGKKIDTEEVRKIIREAPTEQAKKVVEQQIEVATVSKARSILDAKKKKLAELKKKKKKPLSDQAFSDATEDATQDEDAEIKALEEEIRKETYDELLEDYKSQPTAQMRTSSSIGNQAYSTPLPIAYLAGELARVGDATTVFEPTAGHGALMIGADPDAVTANEIDPDRRKTLEESGFKVTNKDASQELAVPEKSQDSIVMNPPFGKLDSPVDFDNYKITKRDHLIALKNLMAMKDSGRAVLILGANLQENNEVTTPDRVFLNYLYNNYNVADHFEIGGKLYDRMGASFPIRMITIAGRKKSQTFPDYQQIKRIGTYDDLYTRFTEAHSRSERVYSPNEERGTGSAPSGEGIQNPTESGVIKTYELNRILLSLFSWHSL